MKIYYTINILSPEDGRPCNYNYKMNNDLDLLQALLYCLKHNYIVTNVFMWWTDDIDYGAKKNFKFESVTDIYDIQMLLNEWLETEFNWRKEIEQGK